MLLFPVTKGVFVCLIFQTAYNNGGYIKLHLASSEYKRKVTSELHHGPGMKNDRLIKRIIKAQESRRKGVTICEERQG